MIRATALGSLSWKEAGRLKWIQETNVETTVNSLAGT